MTSPPAGLKKPTIELVNLGRIAARNRKTYQKNSDRTCNAVINKGKSALWQLLFAYFFARSEHDSLLLTALPG
jgi:hypothetical protein